MKHITAIEDLYTLIQDETMLVVYFSNDACNVCKVLKPKIAELLTDEFPKVAFAYVDTGKNPETAGQFRVFSIPTIDIYVDGKEQTRFSRNVTLFEFEAAIERPYKILFSE
ncbi:thioredoxin family protein [Bacteroidota bacterium]